MTFEIDPIYDDFFPESGIGSSDWDRFRTDASGADFQVWKTKNADLKEISSTNSWKDTAIKISTLLLKIVLFPWGIYDLCKFLLNRYALSRIYPAQYLCKEELFLQRKIALEERNLNGGIMRHVRLEKNGKSYSAFIIGKESTIQNGKWALHANGNRASIEKECSIFPNYLDGSYLKEDVNVLLVNGPGVGCSSPMETLEELGDSQELGLIFLESALKAREIMLTGVSLGAAAQSMAINQHNFLTDRIYYAVVRLGTFDRLSNLVRVLVGNLGAGLLAWLGHEMDSVKASEKLHELGIHEYLFGNDTDPLIRSASLTANERVRKLTPQKRVTPPGEEPQMHPLKEGETKAIITFSITGHYYCANHEISRLIQLLRDSRSNQLIAG